MVIFQLNQGGVFELVLHDKTSIDYLLKRKFGYIGPVFQSISQLSSGGASPPQQDRQKLIERYKNELTTLTNDELDRLFQSEKAKEIQLYLAKRDAEEAARSFNQAIANLDIEHWSRISFWTLDEGVAISLNRDPRRVSWDGLKSLTNVSAFAAKYQANLMLVERAKEMGQLWAKTTPGTFLAWAERTRFEMPVELVEIAKSLGVQVADWKTHYDEQMKRAEVAQSEVNAINEKSIATSQEFIAFIDRMRATQKEVDKTQSDRMDLLKRQLAEATQRIKALEPEQKQKITLPTDLSPRVKDTLLKMIIGMAMDNYGFVPSQARSPFPAELSGILMGQGLDVTDETIRKYLREAAALLPRPIAE